MSKKRAFPYGEAELRSRFDRYLAACKAAERMPTLEGYAGALEISSRRLRAFLATAPREGDKKTANRQEVVLQCLDVITDQIQQNTDTMSRYRLQNIYDGLEKQAGNQTLTIRVVGEDGVPWGA